MMDVAPSTVRGGSTDAAAPWTWLLVSALATTALSLAAAHAPARIRLIGLFSAAFGAVMGWLIVQLAIRFETQTSPRILGVIAMLLTVCGLIGSTWETCRLEQRSQSKSTKDAVAARMIEQMKDQGQTGPDESVSIELPVWVSLRRYLARRVQQLGTWSSPWPELFWVAEITLAAIVSFWVAIRSSLHNQPVLNDVTTTPP